MVLSKSEKMTFEAAGGQHHLRLESGRDLAHLPNLDPKLWAALSCPIDGLALEKRTLEFVDTNGDGRIRREEILDAVAWTFSMLKNPQELHLQKDALALENINENNPEGRGLIKSAQLILNNLGKCGVVEVSLADTMDTGKILSNARGNGDGIIPPGVTDDPLLDQAIKDILLTVGGEKDRNAKDGATLESVERFFEAAEGFVGWWRRGHGGGGRPDCPIMIFGEETPACYEAFAAVAEAIDRFFFLHQLADYESEAIPLLNLNAADLQTLKELNPPALEPALARFPIAPIQHELDLNGKLNPYYRESLQKFKTLVVAPIFDPQKHRLSRRDWLTVKEKMGSYARWLAGKKGHEVASLGIATLERYLELGVCDRLKDLIREDRKVAEEIKAIVKVEKLVRFHRDLFVLCKNFVSFPDFYAIDKRAIFQAGMLYLDGRSFQLCIFVEDYAKHAALAAEAGIFLVYCELRDFRTGEKRYIMAAVTRGSTRRLVPCKNGVFYDRQGRDWDATIVKVVAHPVSLAQGIFAPFKRLFELVATQVEKITATREKEMLSGVSKGVTDLTANPPPPAKTKADAESDGAGAAGLLTGGGVALAALSSSFAFMSSTLSKIDKVYFLYTAVVFLVFVFLPSSLFAWFKWRSRDLGILLDACGWSINGHMRLNLALGRVFTRRARLPRSSRKP